MQSILLLMWFQSGTCCFRWTWSVAEEGS